MGKAIVVIGDTLRGDAGGDQSGLKKQSCYGGDPWKPGTLPTGVLRTKVRYDSPAPYGQHSMVEMPKKKTGRKP